MSSTKTAGTDLGLSDEEKQELHRIARAVIEAKAKGQPVPCFPPATDRLKEKRGAFVCIYKTGMLRGCIGTLEARAPMYMAVQEMAEASAFRDPRFRAVTEDELPYLSIEISILTPFHQIQDPEEVQVGPHGLVIRKGFQSGLLLPQVATERNWDRITFLQETCRKAGLPRDAWQDKDTELYVFSADVF
jgi:AmmeMemoRadiSam system protein A